MGDRPRDVGSSRALPPLDVERFTFPTAWLCLLPYVLSWDCLGSFPIQATTCYPMPARAMVST